MDIDPHTIQQLLEKVRSQLRCPQCTRRVSVALDSLKVVGDAFAVFQLKCTTCDAYIVLHATLRGGVIPPSRNYSTILELNPQELQLLRDALRKAEGCFTVLFEETP